MIFGLVHGARCRERLIPELAALLHSVVDEG